jgi:hypothetical protein
MKRLALALALLAAGAAATALLSIGTAGAAQPPTVQNVQEQNVDTNGNIKMHEQGTAKTQEQNVDAQGNIKVHEQGTVQVGGSVSVSNLPGTQPVSGTVNVGNFPTAPKTVIISTGAGPVGLGGAVIAGPIDVSAYRELTLYLHVTTGLGAGTCTFYTFPTAFPENNLFPVDSIAFGNDPNVIKTVDPAPPVLQLNCDLNGFTAVPITWMLVGRTG